MKSLTGEFADLVGQIHRAAGAEPFQLAVILGSGLSAVAAGFEPLAEWPYRDCPGLTPSRVAGHAGRLLAGRFGAWRVLCFCGRTHLYEGYDPAVVIAPVRVAHALGCRRLLLTNAAGGIHPEFRPGDVMAIADHLNLFGANPLRGLSPPPFLDLCGLYQERFFPALSAFAARRKLRLQRGVLAFCPGPSYETPAEVRALARLGADAVSMSTVPEAIMGRYFAMEVAGLSLIANHAAGLGAQPLSHAEVLAAGQAGAGSFAALFGELLRLWIEQPDPVPVPTLS
jgi:purine-nucleoside phosphorylase